MATCTACGENKEPEAFPFKNAAAGLRHRKCKACMAAYGRGHYARNRQVYITRNVENMRLRRRVLKQKVWEYLVAHGCVDCGETDPVVLEFDHVDPATKKSEIYWLTQCGYGWTCISAEINKCQVRCANCHRRRTAEQFSWQKTKTTGDAHERSQRRRLRRPPRIERSIKPSDVPTGQRWCGACGVIKPLDEFYATNKSTCAACFRTYRRAHYRLTREAYIQRNSRLLRVRGRRWLQMLWDYLAARGCSDCGEADRIVLEMDHVDRATKLYAVSSVARAGYPWTTVEAEIAKCVVRCANCHRGRTAVQFNWPKLQLRGRQETSGPGGTRTPETSRMRTERSPN